MIPSLRQSFNSKYKPEKYPQLLSLLAERCGVPIGFRVSETPCFLPRDLIDRMANDGKELIRATGGQSGVPGSFVPVDSARVQCASRVAASDVYPGGFRAGARCGRGTAAKAGGVAGLPFSLCLPAGSGSNLHRRVRSGPRSEISARRARLGFLSGSAAACDRGGRRIPKT